MASRIKQSVLNYLKKNEKLDQTRNVIQRQVREKYRHWKLVLQ